MSDTFDHEGDAWASLDWCDGEDDSPGWGLRRQPRCYRCAAVCTWHHTGVHWRLMGPDGKLHSCSKPASADDFEDVS